MGANEHSKVSRYREHLAALEEAIEWLGTSQGRASAYERVLKEFFEEDMRSREHVLAYSESCEVVDMHRLWETRADSYPGLREKIRDALSKGPLLREDEKPRRSSNRARNDAFVYLLAGRIIRAGITVTAIEGTVAGDVGPQKDTDITFMWEGSIIDVECKRPQRRKALEKRLNEASEQLTAPSRHGRMGVIAVDCSALVRPPGALIEGDSAELAGDFLGWRLERMMKSELLARPLPSAILGFLLWARAPAMIRVTDSSILSLNGEPYTYFRPETIFVLKGRNNSAPSRAPDLLPSVCRRLEAADC
jgi:hypothetical protein